MKLLIISAITLYLVGMCVVFLLMRALHYALPPEARVKTYHRKIWKVFLWPFYLARAFYDVYKTLKKARSGE